jgi:hypothetical protein
MQRFLYSLADFFTPKPAKRPMTYSERLCNFTVVEAINDCGEKRYIEIPKPMSMERRENLEILLTKCNKLLSFMTKIKKYNDDICYKVIELSDRVRQSMYMNDDITHLFDDFERLNDKFRRSSRSSINLSSVEIL